MQPVRKFANNIPKISILIMIFFTWRIDEENNGVNVWKPVPILQSWRTTLVDW